MEPFGEPLSLPIQSNYRLPPGRSTKGRILSEVSESTAASVRARSNSAAPHPPEHTNSFCHRWPRGAVHAAPSSTRISWSGQRATRPTQHPRVEFVSEKCAPVNKLCNVAQSARSRRETYIGPWLPEPVDTSSAPLGSSTGRGAGVRGLVTTRETLSYGTSSVCFPGSVRLLLPTDCRSPATRRSEHPPIGGL